MYSIYSMGLKCLATRYISKLILCSLIIASLSCKAKHDEDHATKKDKNIVPNSTGMPVDTINAKITNLNIERLFWENRIKMAQDKSIDLALDLIDSMVTLEIKGVRIRPCKISDYLISGNLLDLKQEPELLTWLENPFILQNQWADIPKEPIKIRYITSDDTMPDNYFELLKENIEDINIVLHYNRNLILHICQEINHVVSDSLIQNNSQGELLGSGYRITLSVNINDAKAIYRALSSGSELILRY